MKKTKKRKRKVRTAPWRPSLAQMGAGKLARRDSGQSLSVPPNSPDQGSRAQILARMHPDLVGDSAYARLSESMSMPVELGDASWQAPLQFQQQMRAKDALERLAYTQILMAHARTAWLATLATRQTDVKALAIILEACDRASSTFVKLMRATSEYRQPKIPPTNVSIGQANVAQQQVVQNIQGLEAKRIENDEQTKIGPDIHAEEIPAITHGLEIAEGRNPAHATLDEKHGAKECRGKGHLRHERV
jgi:hypothetical protein